MSRSIMVLPDDSAQPILDAIGNAKRSLRIKMFVFSDPSLLAAVIAAHHRGVNVRVMLNPERRDGEKENGESREALTAAGIEVRDSNPCFDLTHEKSMFTEDELPFFPPLTSEPPTLPEPRDSPIFPRHKHEV